ncbi:probable E3 ubiquitin-protein ligase LUL4 [Malania oleifera]|uniref:probable E3 ubiquitin-protein ligase LUL4 n=1 Tax=Malania oleifera TaxID=397392 RepID=UPI0025ADF999|nr:probable E3 ubiquitin-protein ligase LUL4 [Malania oleifera]XP_057956798.1 probable E3 ubiquitin-protein ligase LUL4 [Malania oleifera]
MGISWSNRRRNNNYFQSHPPVLPPHLASSSYFYSSEPTPLPAPPHNYVFAANAPYPAPTPPPYPNPTHNFYAAHPPLPPPFYSSSGHSSCNYGNAMMVRPNFPLYYANQSSGWPAPAVIPAPPPPPYVEHQNAKKVRNDVNVHKDTLRIEVDEQNPDHHLVSFVFDAIYDGSITIFYFAKEEPNCKFIPLYPEAFMPVRIPFHMGLGQKFRQPPGTGIDLGFFELDDLSKSSPGEDVFPLVISAETCPPSHPSDEHLSESIPGASPHLQITQAVLEKNNGDPFQVRVIRQILWVDGVRYELREIFGIGNSAAEGFNDSDTGKDCVICMTEPKDTAVLPCRHMCMCGECAKALRLQSNNCPICRQPIEELIEIKINNGDQ